jgi:hypothetical protein
MRVLCASCALWPAPAPAHIVEQRSRKHTCASMCVHVFVGKHIHEEVSECTL